MMRPSWALGASLLLGCYSANDSSSGGEGEQAPDPIDWGAHADGDDGAPYLGGPSDQDGDGIGDEFDPDPGSSQQATWSDDFESGGLDGWTPGGGEWGLTDDGEVVQTGTCRDDSGQLLSANGVDLADLYVRVDLLQLPSPGCGLANFAPGLFVRGADGSYLACTIGLDPQYGTFLDLVRYDGREERLDQAESEVVQEGWLTMELVADGTDVTCRAVGLSVAAYDTSGAAGAAGLYTMESPALFDNFAVFAIE